MARAKFEVYCAEGRRYISGKEKDSLVLSRQITQVTPTRFKYIGQTKTFHSFVDLAQWFTVQQLSPEQVRRYLERLEVLWRLGKLREWQSEETPEGFEQRLELMGMPQGGFVQPLAGIR